MIDDSDPQRDALHETLQRHPPVSQQGAVLTGWVMTAEWMDTNGERWLTKGHSAALPTWTAKGLHHEALYGDWHDEEDD